MKMSKSDQNVKIIPYNRREWAQNARVKKRNGISEKFIKKVVQPHDYFLMKNTRSNDAKKRGQNYRCFYTPNAGMNFHQFFTQTESIFDTPSERLIRPQYKPQVDNLKIINFRVNF